MNFNILGLSLREIHTEIVLIKGHVVVIFFAFIRPGIIANNLPLIVLRKLSNESHKLIINP